jgi:Ca-activated chloride channel family protein
MNKKMNSFKSVWVGVCLAVFLGWAVHAQAAGLLIADGGFGGVLEIKEHEVKVVINNGVAVTHVTQVFHNTEKRQVEALYTFPVPRGASVSNFSMWINGKEMIGEVLEKKRAREIYDSYKQQRKDPGLLEQKDYKTFEMRIFPIGPDADQRVQITYYQELDIDHDQAVYVYPLATVSQTNVTVQVTGKFAFNLEVKSAIPITRLESPSHGEAFVVADHSDTYKLASLEATGGSLASDVVINYDLARPKTGIDLITSKDGLEDGFFYLTFTAGKELSERDAGMDYVFLMDISGSMGNDSKLALSRNSVEAFVEELGPEDRFEVMTFNVKADAGFGALRPASDENKKQALEYMGSQRARGGTVLSPAMSAAYNYADADRTLNVVILSDGMTEQTERSTLLQMIASRPRNARVFCIGVGNEVNRPMLEQMAEDSGGLAAFISRGDNFKRQAQAFRRKLMRPVAADLRIEFSGIRVYDMEPQTLPNLYHGAPVRLYGRYSGSGQADVTVKGNIQGQEFNQTLQLNFPGEDGDNPEIERMWAWKRVDQLLKIADRSGSRDSVIDEIVRLGEGFSIVTEYTSFLVLENDNEYQRWKIERTNLRRIQRDRDAQARAKARLDSIRDKAVSDIGPQAEPKNITMAKAPAPSQVQAAPPAVNRPAPVTPAPSNGLRQRQSWDLNVGGGPVGPLFVGLAYWLRRRKAKK